MPIQIDYALVRFEDGQLVVALTPPTPIGGWTIQYTEAVRFGTPSASGIVIRSTASGYNGVSGITVLNSGVGEFSVEVRSVDSSGREFGNYAFWIERLDSGSRTMLTQGYKMLKPS